MLLYGVFQFILVPRFSIFFIDELCPCISLGCISHELHTNTLC
jgi:hypothetical protein